VKRLERLYAIVEYLRTQRLPVTAARLAERFETTERTIYRDLAALRDREVPIHGDPGPAGGLHLGREYSMPPLALTADEVFSMWLSLRIDAIAQPLASGHTLGQALSKVLASLPDARRRQAERVLSRVVISKPPSPALMAGAAPIVPAIFRACERAFLASHPLRLTYIDRAGVETRRLVEPHGLMLSGPLWYLLANDVDKAAPRSFRLDRIIEAHIDEGRRFEASDPRLLFREITEHGLELQG